MRLLYLLLVYFFLELGFSAPVPSPPVVVHKPGDFVGVRPAAYEEKSKENKKVSIHPGVVIAGPSTEGTYQVGMISKSLPDNPPQASIHTLHPESNIYGSVSLARPKDVHGSMMKPWKDSKTGNTDEPGEFGENEEHDEAPCQLESNSKYYIADPCKAVVSGFECL